MVSVEDSRLLYNVHLEPEPEGGFTVTVPALPGCVTWGRDYNHALEMAEEAIQCMIEAMNNAGEEIPMEECLLRDVTVRVRISHG